MSNQLDAQLKNLSLDQLIQKAVSGKDIVIERENMPEGIVLITQARYTQLTKGQRNPDLVKVKLMGQRNPDTIVFEVQGQRNPD